MSIMSVRVGDDDQVVFYEICKKLDMTPSKQLKLLIKQFNDLMYDEILIPEQIIQELEYKAIFWLKGIEDNISRLDNDLKLLALAVSHKQLKQKMKTRMWKQFSKPFQKQAKKKLRQLSRILRSQPDFL